jgi:hypothetical protein
VKANAKVSVKTPKQSKAATASQSATQNTISGSQRTSVGGGGGGGGGGLGLSGLVKKAHIPTPPKVKAAPQKETKKKFDIRADDDESEESEDSE